MSRIKVIIEKPDRERRKTFLGEMFLAAKESPFLFIRPVLGMIDSIRSDAIEVVGDTHEKKAKEGHVGFVRVLPPKKHLRRQKDYEVHLAKAAEKKAQEEEISV